MKLERKLYAFFLSKNANMFDVKEKVKVDFGFDMSQVKVYFQYQELKDTMYLMDVDDFDIEEDFLIVITNGPPKIDLKVVMREPLDDIKIADVRFLNSVDKDDPKNVNHEFDVDQEKLVWPAYRDWTAELAYLSDTIATSK